MCNGTRWTNPKRAEPSIWSWRRCTRARSWCTTSPKMLCSTRCSRQPRRERRGARRHTSPTTPMPLPGELPADSALDGMADVVVLVPIGSGRRLVVAGRGAQPEQCLAGDRPPSTCLNRRTGPAVGRRGIATAARSDDGEVSSLGRVSPAQPGHWRVCPRSSPPRRCCGGDPHIACCISPCPGTRQSTPRCPAAIDRSRHWLTSATVALREWPPSGSRHLPILAY
jgi:hypothetical protein